MDETRIYFLEEIEQNEFMSKNHKKFCTTLHWIEHSLILASAITWRISISAFASLLGISIRIMDTAIGLKICAIAAGIKNLKSLIKRMEKKHDKIVLLRKSKVNGIEVLLSKALIYLNISHDEYVLINTLWWYEKINQKCKGLIGSSIILVYL